MGALEWNNHYEQEVFNGKVLYLILYIKHRRQNWVWAGL